MFIIYGWRDCVESIGSGKFFCPLCQRHTDYNHQQLRTYVTFFFIPVIPLGAGARAVECQQCQKSFIEEVLAMSGPTSGSMNGTASGDRILAKRGGFWYAGTVRGKAGKRIKVQFDDGKQDHLCKEHVIPLDLREGDPIFVRATDTADYQFGTILGFDDDRLQVRMDDGHEVRTKFANVRVVWDDEETN